ncbi:hypothetical protein ACS7SF_13090 [Ralstonia sp. 25C]|uniref:hypothetical protein n=1 Tax=Ralstonia sp. 25C TaxID=3447363 RepID=UPI003F755A8A
MATTLPSWPFPHVTTTVQHMHSRIAKIAFITAITEAVTLIAINIMATSRETYTEGVGIVPSGVGLFAIILLLILLSSALWILLLLITLTRRKDIDSGGRLILGVSLLARVFIVSVQLYVIFSAPHYS